jgi:hypothetical protein
MWKKEKIIERKKFNTKHATVLSMHYGPGLCSEYLLTCTHCSYPHRVVCMRVSFLISIFHMDTFCHSGYLNPYVFLLKLGKFYAWLWILFLHLTMTQEHLSMSLIWSHIIHLCLFIEYAS